MHAGNAGELDRRDLELVRRAAGAERAAFDALFERFAARVHRFVARRAPDRHAAEALTQRALEAVFRDLAGYAGEELLDAWVLRRVAAQLASGPRTAATPPDPRASDCGTRSAWLPPAAETPS
jgi:DNA-directed RNA polymerase specialized sigma24 family protein